MWHYLFERRVTQQGLEVTASQTNAKWSSPTKKKSDITLLYIRVAEINDLLIN